MQIANSIQQIRGCGGGGYISSMRGCLTLELVQLFVGLQKSREINTKPAIQAENARTNRHTKHTYTQNNNEVSDFFPCVYASVLYVCCICTLSVFSSVSRTAPPTCSYKIQDTFAVATNSCCCCCWCCCRYYLADFLTFLWLHLKIPKYPP